MQSTLLSVFQMLSELFKAVVERKTRVCMGVDLFIIIILKEYEG